jgi:hypothetical protein
MIETTQQQEDLDIRTGLKAGDNGQFGSGSAVGGGTLGSGSAADPGTGALGSGH